VDFPIPQNSFVWVPLKMGSRARNRKTAAAMRLGCVADRPHAAQASNTVKRCSLPAGRCSACSLLIYPPTRARWPARAGGLWGGFSSPARLACMGSARNGLASSRPQAAAGSAPSALPDSQAPRSRLPAWELPARPTLHLPCTSPGSPTLHLPYAYAYAYRPTPLPGRLPCTRPHPAYPAPALPSLLYLLYTPLVRSIFSSIKCATPPTSLLS
jgi:hypothetical protein